MVMNIKFSLKPIKIRFSKIYGLRKNTTIRIIKPYNMTSDNSIEQDIKDRIAKGLISDDLEPIKCICGNVEFYDKVIDSVQNLAVEINRHCRKCDRIVGIWSCGHWMP